MAHSAHHEVALLSIQPRFVDAIVDGTKRVEFRRRGFGRPVSHVVIYATSPIRKVVGLFVVAAIVQDSALALWRRYEDISGLERAEFMSYMTGARQPIAIAIAHLHLLEQPLELQELGPALAPPQSYRYLQGEALEVLAR